MWDRMHRDERIEAIRVGAKAGLSTTQIAAQIGGCTRNAVIGLASRAKIQLGPARHSKGGGRGRKPPVDKSVRKKDSPPVAKVPKAASPLLPPIVKRREKPKIEAPVYGFPDEHYRTQLEKMKSGQCRWPQWGSEKKPGTEAYIFCGKPVKSGSPYCHRCHRRAYNGFMDPRGRVKDQIRIDEVAAGKRIRGEV